MFGERLRPISPSSWSARTDYRVKDPISLSATDATLWPRPRTLINSEARQAPPPGANGDEGGGTKLWCNSGSVLGQLGSAGPDHVLFAWGVARAVARNNKNRNDPISPILRT